MRYKCIIIIFIMVISVPVHILFAQGTDAESESSESWFESRWEHNEQESLSKLPPELRADLLKVKEIDLEQYGELLHNAAHAQFDEYFGYMDASEKERHETEVLVEQLEIQTRALGIQFEYATDSQKNDLILKLKASLEKLFDIKEKERKLEVEMLEKELAKLKESLEVRKKNKAQIINRRLSELTGMGDYLDW